MKKLRVNDAKCRRCDDAGILQDRRPCTCAAGAIVLDQLAKRAELTGRQPARRLVST